MAIDKETLRLEYIAPHARQSFFCACCNKIVDTSTGFVHNYSRQQGNTEMETIKVQVGGTKFDLDAVVNLMDDDLRELLHGYHYNSEQEFVDVYAEHHKAKFGSEFTVN